MARPVEGLLLEAAHLAVEAQVLERRVAVPLLDLHGAVVRAQHHSEVLVCEGGAGDEVPQRHVAILVRRLRGLLAALRAAGGEEGLQRLLGEGGVLRHVVQRQAAALVARRRRAGVGLDEQREHRPRQRWVAREEVQRQLAVPVGRLGGVAEALDEHGQLPLGEPEALAQVVQRQVAVPVRHARLPVVALEEEREDLVRPIGLVGEQRVQGEHARARVHLALAALRRVLRDRALHLAQRDLG